MAEESKKRAEAKAAEESAPQSDAAAPKKDLPETKAILSNAEEAGKLNAQFAPWVYEIPKWTATRFRQGRSDLIEKKEQAAEPVHSSGSSPGKKASTARGSLRN